MRTLILFRHAKAEPLRPDLNDIDRPLSTIGQKAAKKMGMWFQDHVFPIDLIICSPALRTQETLASVKPYLKIQDKNIEINEQLYLASLEQLLLLLAKAPKKSKNLMLIGHNPGFEDLLTYLCGEYIPRSRNGKIMPTASLARINLPNDWHKFDPGKGKLLDLIRPKELD